MRVQVLVALLPGLLATLLVSASAHAHFKLQQPADWLQTDENGDPLGATGTQKLNPCGDGPRSGAITQVRAGSMLHIKLTETIPHGGHYRVALVPKLNPIASELPEPAVTLNAGQCDTAAIENPVVAPVLADNLFPHIQAQATAGKVWETDVRLPNQTGDATLQIIEFMAPHAPQCFYHHCAQLQIVAENAAIDSGALGTTSDAGQGVIFGGPTQGDDGSGCAIGGNRSVGIFAIAPLAVLVSALRRRARKRSLPDSP
jgi:hypothetical protein